VLADITEEDLEMSRRVQVCRDSFAGETTVREVIVTELGCSWCGENPHDRLFRYGVEPDSVLGRIAWSDGFFCSVVCWRVCVVVERRGRC
jgi:hypothetical protein